MFQHSVRPPNVSADQSRRIECIWANGGKALRTVITTVQDVPEGRSDSFYGDLSLPDLLKEIRASIECVTFHRNRMNAEMRERLLPALRELRKRTYRRNPGFYKTLEAMGLNGDLVRQWFYKSRTAEEVIDLVEESQPEVASKNDSTERTGKEQVVLAMDRLAKAVNERKLTYARKLATQWIEARGLL